MTSSSESPSFFERPSTIWRIIAGLGGLCAVTVLADLFYENPHPHFDLEKSFGFQAWFGFLAFVVIVFLGRILRLIISRPEDYYEPVEEPTIDRSWAASHQENADGK